MKFLIFVKNQENKNYYFALCLKIAEKIVLTAKKLLQIINIALKKNLSVKIILPGEQLFASINYPKKKKCNAAKRQMSVQKYK